jgi:hypothetical protein
LSHANASGYNSPCDVGPLVQLQIANASGAATEREKS